ncbi:MAG: selenocysteine-specific translation elongation factor [Acidobacteriota bacterium]|nr:selenocysteine-specific translation elongation factor [Acidobacteriota bacterium]
MKRTIVGTAGHIDHGKTRLIEALTGIDCDRWAEEKTRGITIDLGFAHLEREDIQVGFVDVPGHERFLHNALAGLGGIRVMLLVVAADEGVKPQTREHLAICSLLNIPAAVVALTKCDLVTSDLLELAQLEILELLAPTPFAEASILPVSSVTGEGIEDLESELLELARCYAVVPRQGEATRLPVDRVFLLKGLGLVVTGTLASGELAPGDVLEKSGSGKKARVRSIQIHGQSRETANAGERTALQLTGMDHQEIERGDQLTAPDAFRPARRLLARFTLLSDAPRAIKGSTAVRVHLLSSNVGGRLRPLEPASLQPGETGLVEIRCSTAITVVPGDHLIVRRPSPPATMGGGQILDTSWRPRRGKKLGKALAALNGERSQILFHWIVGEGERGASTRDLAQRLGVRDEVIEPELEALAKKQKLLSVPPGTGHGQRWLDPEAYRRVSRRAQRELTSYFRKERLAEGMPKAEALERILPGGGAELADVYLDWLTKQRVLTVDGGSVNLPGRQAELSSEESGLARSLLTAFETAALEPPAPSHLSDLVGGKPQTIDGVLEYLIRRGKLLRLPGGLVIAASAVDEVAGDLRKSHWTDFSVGDFKERFGLTRKWAIPLLEHLDSTGTTRRVENRRQIVR